MKRRWCCDEEVFKGPSMQKLQLFKGHWVGRASTLPQAAASLIVLRAER